MLDLFLIISFLNLLGTLAVFGILPFQKLLNKFFLFVGASAHMLAAVYTLHASYRECEQHFYV